MKKNTRSVSIILFIAFLILGLLLSTIVLMSFNRFIVRRSIIILAIIIYLTLSGKEFIRFFIFCNQS